MAEGNGGPRVAQAKRVNENAARSESEGGHNVVLLHGEALKQPHGSASAIRARATYGLNKRPTLLLAAMSDAASRILPAAA